MQTGAQKGAYEISLTLADINGVRIQDPLSKVPRDFVATVFNSSGEQTSVRFQVVFEQDPRIARAQPVRNIPMSIFRDGLWAQSQIDHIVNGHPVRGTFFGIWATIDWRWIIEMEPNRPSTPEEACEISRYRSSPIFAMTDAGTCQQALQGFGEACRALAQGELKVSTENLSPNLYHMKVTCSRPLGGILKFISADNSVSELLHYAP